MMQSRVGPFARGVVGGPFHRVCDAVATTLGIPTSKVPQAALLHAFKEAGWIDCGRLASGEFKTKKQVFAVKEFVDRYSKSELRRMVESVASEDGKVVRLR
jgi:hypothetical protein